MHKEASPDDLFAAAASGDIPKVKLALASGVNIDAVDNRGWTAAMWAAHKHQLGVMKLLNKLDADFAVRDPINHDAWDISAMEYLGNDKASIAIRSLVTDNPHYVAKQAEYAAQAYVLADKLKKLLGGRISREIVAYVHADWLLKTKYEGMRCEFHVFAGGFDLWIQNSPRRKVQVYFNLENEDNLNAPETDNPIRIAEVFSPIYQAYAMIDINLERPPQYEQAREFVADDDIHASVVGLHLGRYEWLVISIGQIRLRSQSEDLDFIMARLKHLVSIFNAASRLDK